MRVFNILKRWLLVLVCAVSSVCAMEFTKRELCEGIPIAKVVCAEDMSKKTGDFESILDSERTALAEKISEYPDASHVVLFGDTGAGKTTLANLLKGEEVVAEEIDGDILLAAQGIYHGVGSGTKQICCYYSESNNTCYWDLPGLRDSNGWEKDTLNAILRKQLFDSLLAAKLVIVAKKADITGRATNFGALLKYIVDVFPEIENLQLCSYLAITQGSINNMHAFLEGVLRNSGSDSKLSDASVNDLLTFIATNSVQRTSTFVVPSDIGLYGVEATQQMLVNLGSVEEKKLVYKAILQPDTIHHVREKAGEYNAQIADFIRGDISRSIKAAVYDQISSAIERHDKTAEQLKELFGGYAARLVSLDAATYGDDLKSFLTELGLGDTVVNDSRFNLFSMLTTFGGLLEESLRAPDLWVDALVGIVGELDQLSKFETMKIISVIRDDYEFGDFKLERDIFKRNKWGKNEKKGEIWSKEIRKDISYYLRTAFVGGLILEEPVQHETLTVGKREGERDGGNWRN